jgi:hypothetical protein
MRHVLCQSRQQIQKTVFHANPRSQIKNPPLPIQSLPRQSVQPSEGLAITYPIARKTKAAAPMHQKQRVIVAEMYISRTLNIQEAATHAAWSATRYNSSKIITSLKPIDLCFRGLPENNNGVDIRKYTMEIAEPEITVITLALE